MVPGPELKSYFVRFFVGDFMKKFLIFISLVLMTLCFSACGVKGKEVLYIESFDWKMSAVMLNDTAGRSERELVVAVGEFDEIYPSVQIVDLKLTAKNCSLTLVDSTNDKAYYGTYHVTEEENRRTVYSLVIDGVQGTAELSRVKLYDGTETPTLPIVFDGYTLYFSPFVN